MLLRARAVFWGADAGGHVEDALCDGRHDMHDPRGTHGWILCGFMMEGEEGREGLGLEV